MLTFVDTAGRTRNRRGQFAKAVPTPPPMLKWWRLKVFEEPRGPWLESQDQMMDFAVRQGLASWDESKREHYLAVPVGMIVREATSMPSE